MIEFVLYSLREKQKGSWSFSMHPLNPVCLSNWKKITFTDTFSVITVRSNKGEQEETPYLTLPSSPSSQLTGRRPAAQTGDSSAATESDAEKHGKPGGPRLSSWHPGRLRQEVANFSPAQTA